ncbi:MAG: hypothetical protein K1X55_06775 [Chitinophagales bacterium]|nr:hypothetical protein [Chitinophagales bacterium]
MNLYLDIDGVLLTTKNTRIPPCSSEFISFIVEHFDCFWLTTHCKGDSNVAIKYLSQYYDVFLLEKLSRIRSTNWDMLKTEAIDFANEFIWLEDCPMNAEKSVLKEKGKLESLLIVDLSNVNELNRLVLHLKNYID